MKILGSQDPPLIGPERQSALSDSLRERANDKTNAGQKDNPLSRFEPLRSTQQRWRQRDGCGDAEKQTKKKFSNA